MPRPLLIVSQSNYLINVVDTNSHTYWQIVKIQISWLLQKPADLDQHWLLRQGISGFSRTRVKSYRDNIRVTKKGALCNEMPYSYELNSASSGFQTQDLVIRSTYYSTTWMLPKHTESSRSNMLIITTNILIKVWKYADLILHWYLVSLTKAGFHFDSVFFFKNLICN